MVFKLKEGIIRRYYLCSILPEKEAKKCNHFPTEGFVTSHVSCHLYRRLIADTQITIFRRWQVKKPV